MTPLLLIPGMMCDARMWGDLSALAADREIRHAVPTEGFSTSEMAAAILCDAPPRFALAGLSMGGIVAMEILAQAPARVERLALLDTNPRAELDEVKQRRAGQIERVQKGDLDAVLRDEMKPNYLWRQAAGSEILDLCMQMALDLGPEIFVRQSSALRDRPDRRDVLTTFDRPALVLMGEDDRLCPLDRHELMHALMPQSRLVIVPRAGHLPPLENPIDTMAALALWLEE
ncbi:alpha/beta hydrolase [Rhizobium sp. SSA_523]|nr:alpha/beta hydrolase [Rhizobium sp. SSA_523]WKC22545.1 alpha/beta hydrolase [Rhizobium sp. SSA_523]